MDTCFLVLGFFFSKIIQVVKILGFVNHIFFSVAATAVNSDNIV